MRRLFPLVFLLLPTLVPAATLHVSQKAPGAADTNIGTAEAPFVTISAALKKLQPGDRVTIHAGVYRETLEFKTKAADWTEPTVIAAAPGEEVIIKGSDVVTGWEKHEGRIWKKPDWKVNSQLVFANGERLQQIAGEMVPYLTEGGRWRGRVGESIKDMTAGSFYYDLKAKVLYVWLKDGGDPNQATMEVGVRPFLLKTESDFLIVKGLKMSQTSTGNYINWPAVILTGDHIIFQDNEVTWCDAIGLGFTGRYVEVLNSKFNWCGNSGIGGNSLAHCRMIGNETSYNNWRRWSTGWHAGGIKMIPWERGLLIDRHKAIGNFADGIWIDSYDSGNVFITNCESAYNEGNGIHYEIANRGVIANNRLHHNAGRGVYLSSSSDCLVVYNTCYGNGMSGIVSHGVNRQGPVERFGEWGIVPARNNQIFGNILCNNMNPKLKPKGWNYRPELILPNPANNPALFAGNVADCNVYFRNNGEGLPWWFNWGEKVWHDLESWRKDTGNDLHSIVADPLLLDPENGDFHIKPGSPAIGIAPVVGAIAVDCEGRDRPGDRMRSAGAYEIPTDAKPPAATGPAKPAAPAPAVAAPEGKLPLPPPQTLQYREIALPARLLTKLAGPDARLARLGALLKGIETTCEGVRVVFPPEPTAIVLQGAKRVAELPVDLNADVLYFLIGTQGAGGTFGLSVARGDGVTQAATLRMGQEVGPSFGAWTGTLDQSALPPYLTTRLGWQGGPATDPVRLWQVTYVNDNPWLPVQKVSWKTGQAGDQLVVLKAVAGIRR
ncbi:right-handed parallel beta-helix repeat-containing protein [bacterium]|nr:right-handed parallel beta-helix repeat-containing protein [bacterium]